MLGCSARSGRARPARSAATPACRGDTAVHEPPRQLDPGAHTNDGVTHPTYRKGTGPGVILIHEIPGLTPEVIGFGEEVVAAGYTVVMPHLFGRPEVGMSVGSTLGALRQVCVSAEFTKLATGVTSPVAGWLRSLAREPARGARRTRRRSARHVLHRRVRARDDGRPVGRLPVVAQPSIPFAIGKKRGADVNLAPGDLDAVRRRAAAGARCSACATATTRHRHPLRDAHARDRRPLPARGARRQGTRHAHVEPPAGGRRPGPGVLRGEAPLC